MALTAFPSSLFLAMIAVTLTWIPLPSPDPINEALKEEGTNKFKN